MKVKEFQSANPATADQITRLFYDVKLERTRTGESVHQCILNVCYDKWQTEKEWGYVDMLEYSERAYGPIARLLIQLGKYGQQVNNGGHMQYYINGYASNGGGCMETHESMDLHEWMLENYIKYIDPFVSNEKSPIPKVLLMKKFLILMKKFRIELDNERYITETCDVCNGTGYVSGEWNDDIEDYDESSSCYNCDNGTAEYENDHYLELINRDEMDEWDTEYYEINSYIDDFFKINSCIDDLFENVAVYTIGCDTVIQVSQSLLDDFNDFLVNDDDVQANGFINIDTGNYDFFKDKRFYNLCNEIKRSTDTFKDYVGGGYDITYDGDGELIIYVFKTVKA